MTTNWDDANLTGMYGPRPASKSKPITAERRAEIVLAYSWFFRRMALPEPDGDFGGDKPFGRLDVRLEWVLKRMDDLLSAETYWRETVKRLQPFPWTYNNCQFCEGEATENRAGETPPLESHKPDCPWVKAQ